MSAPTYTTSSKGTRDVKTVKIPNATIGGKYDKASYEDLTKFVRSLETPERPACLVLNQKQQLVVWFVGNHKLVVSKNNKFNRLRAGDLNADQIDCVHTWLAAS